MPRLLGEPLKLHQWLSMTQTRLIGPAHQAVRLAERVTIPHDPSRHFRIDHPTSRFQPSPSQSRTVGTSHMPVNGSGGITDGRTASIAPGSIQSVSQVEMPSPAWLRESSTTTKCRSEAFARPSLPSLLTPCREAKKPPNH